MKPVKKEQLFLSQVPRDVHRVVQDAQDFDFSLTPVCAEDQNMPSPAPNARDVQRENAGPNVAEGFHAHPFWPEAQGGNSIIDNFGILYRLRTAEVLGRPTENLVIVGVRGGRSGNMPGGRSGAHLPDRLASPRRIARWASDLRCTRSSCSV